MRVGPTRGIQRTVRTGPVKKTSSVDRVTEVDSVAATGPIVAPREVSDTSAISGIPPEEMTVKVQAAIMSLMEEVDSLRTELQDAKRRLAKMEKEADEDVLIPIANRRAFVREMSRMISFAGRYDMSSSMVFIDVNNMKEVNDSMGHGAGDAVLKHVGNTLSQNVRDLDTVGRLGGDEFGVILAQTDEATAQKKADDLIAQVTGTKAVYQGQEIPVDVAYGVITFDKDQEASEALAEADQKMYEHKKAKKGEDNIR